MKIKLNFFGEDGTSQTNELPVDEPTTDVAPTVQLNDGSSEQTTDFSTENRGDYITKEQIQEMLNTQSKKMIEEALKISQMSEDERKKHDEEERVKTLEEREIALNLRELTLQTENLLLEQGLNKSLAGFVMGDNLESTKDKLKLFKSMLDKEVQMQVEKRIAGKVPVTSNATQNNTLDDARKEIIKGLGGF